MLIALLIIAVVLWRAGWRSGTARSGRRAAIGLGIIAAAGLPAVPGGAQTPPEPLAAGFLSPPASAKPRVWWHWMNGNVTKEGITADLEWMHRVGIGGMQMFEIDLGVPQFTDKRLGWMSPGWKDALQHAAAEAGRLGLEMTMEASGGWGHSGGPWVKPEEAMKKVVWSETAVQGPAQFAGRLPNPPSVNGRFQNVPAPRTFTVPVSTDLPGAKAAPAATPPVPDPTFYHDAVVLAYRVPEDDGRMIDQHPRVTSSDPLFDGAALLAGDLSRSVTLACPDAGQQAWVQFDFARPYRTQALTLAFARANESSSPAIPPGVVQASQDGTNWAPLVQLPGPGYMPDGFPARTYALPDTTARYYRVSFTPPPANPQAPAVDELGRARPDLSRFHLAVIEFHPTPRVNHWQEKAAFTDMEEVEAVPTPAVPANQAVARGEVIDLTGKMRQDGALDWEVPAGRWVILRLGYSLTGKKNHPATPESRGFEVDKLSRRHVESYFRQYAGMVADTLGDDFGRSMRYFLLDSWEAGFENWTEDMIAEFRARRGYDPTPFLPVLTGRVVESADASDRFLWDYRRTLADLFADNYYGTLTEYLHKRNIGVYAEAPGIGCATTADGLQDKGRVDIPMGEFWFPIPGEVMGTSELADQREAASSAHIYGKTIVAAESFTSWATVPGWGQTPFDLKPFADRAFTLGVNRIVVHTSVHQPFVDEAHKPGMTLWAFGQHYSRNITWAEQAVAWNTYLARCSYLLQQGLFVGDIACFYGEGAPRKAHYTREILPAVPPGYNYDYLNAEILLQALTVREGRLVLPDGMSYRLLVLPAEVDRLTLPVLEKIRDLVAAGATVLAPRPRQSPSLSGYPASTVAVLDLTNEVWGAIDGRTVTEHAYGKGRVYWGRTVSDVLAAMRVAPDLAEDPPVSDGSLVWIHRRQGEADIYFVANQQAQGREVAASFRVEGKEAELWHPDTGLIEPAAYQIEGGRTRVPLHLDPGGSVFVVFRHRAAAPRRLLPPPTRTVLATLAGPWLLRFPPHWGAPPAIRLERLASWTAQAEEGVKYFSGTATYTKDIEIAPAWLQPGTKLLLDLGAVKEIAEVTVNGRSLGILWKPPFRLEVSGALQAGSNHLEIQVTNLWPNRLIGDQQTPAGRKYTFTDYQAYRKDSPLLESGLLGPVTLEGETRKP